jgi:hypothetical protein
MTPPLAAGVVATLGLVAVAAEVEPVEDAVVPVEVEVVDAAEPPEDEDADELIGSDAVSRPSPGPMMPDPHPVSAPTKLIASNLGRIPGNILLLLRSPEGKPLGYAKTAS